MNSKIFSIIGVGSAVLLTVFFIGMIFVKGAYAEIKDIDQYSFIDVGNHWSTENVESTGKNYLSLSDSWCTSVEGGFFDKRKQITLTNKSDNIIADGTLVEITVDTATMISSGDLGSNGEDLRIFYVDGNNTCNELNVWWEVGNGSANLADSNLTSVYFRTYSNILAGEKDPSYFLYYSNPTLVTNPQRDIRVLSGDSNDTLFYANFDGNTKNIITGDSGLGVLINYLEEGNAIHFNGIDAVARVPNDSSLQINDQITIEAWVKRQDSSLGGLVFGKGVDYGLGWFSTLFFFKNSHTSYVSVPISNLPVGKWTHVAATYDSTTNTTRIFINGILTTTSTALTGAIPISNNDANLGGRPSSYSGQTSGTASINGNIDEVVVTHGIKYTSNFIPQLYSVPDENTVALYHFDEFQKYKNYGSSLKAYDFAKNNDAILGIGNWYGINVPNQSGPKWVLDAPNYQSYNRKLGVLVSDSSQNLVKNPSFENSTLFDNGWTKDSVNVSTLSNDHSFSGVKGAKLVNSPDLHSGDKGSLWFDGSNDVVNIPNNALLQITGDLTIEFDINKAELSGTTLQDGYNLKYTRTNPVHKSYGNEFSFTIENSGAINYYHGQSTSNYTTETIVPAGLLENYRTYHISIVRDAVNKTVYCYIDGELVSTNTYTIDPSVSTSPIRFGIGYTGFEYKGFIRNVRIWNRTRTSEEIFLDNGVLYTDDRCIELASDGLVANWRMNDLPGQTVADCTGNGLHGTLGLSSSVGSDDPQRGLYDIEGMSYGNYSTEVALEQGQSYVFSVYAKRQFYGDIDNSFLKLNFDGNTIPELETSYENMNDLWFRISAKVVADSTGFHSFGVGIIPGEYVYLDAIQVEPSDILSEYFDGSLSSLNNDVYYWDSNCDGNYDDGGVSVPDDSCSIRLASVLSYPINGNINPAEGTIVFSFKTTSSFVTESVLDSVEKVLFEADSIKIYKTGDSNELFFQMGESKVIVTDDVDWAVGQIHEIVLTWNSNSFSGYVNGIKVGEVLSPQLPLVSGNFNLGAGSQYFSDVIIRDLTIMGVKISDEVVSTLDVEELLSYNISSSQSFSGSHYVKFGVYISEVFDLDSDYNRLGIINWTQLIPSNTSMKVYYRVGDNIEINSRWNLIVSGTDLPIAMDDNRFFQYKVELSLEEGLETPTFTDFNLNYDSDTYFPNLDSNFDIKNYQSNELLTDGNVTFSWGNTNDFHEYFDFSGIDRYEIWSQSNLLGVVEQEDLVNEVKSSLILQNDDWVENTTFSHAFVDELTIEGWYKLDPLTVSTLGFLYSFKDSGSSMYWYTYISKNSTFGTYSLYSIYNRTSISYDITPYIDGNWHHIATTYDKFGYYKVYLDGLLISQSPVTTYYILPAVSMGPFYLGKYYAGANYGINGSIREVRLFDAELTQAELYNWMFKEINDTHPQYSKLFAYYPLNEGEGTFVQEKVDGVMAEIKTSSSFPSWEEIPIHEKFRDIWWDKLLDEGIYEWYVRVYDRAGNYTVTPSVGKFTVDYSGPNGNIIINNGNKTTNNMEVNLDFAYEDLYTSVMGMRYSENKDNLSLQPWGPLIDNISYKYEGGDNLCMYVQYVDVLGNISSIYSDCILYSRLLSSSFINDWEEEAIEEVVVEDDEYIDDYPLDDESVEEAWIEVRFVFIDKEGNPLSNAEVTYNGTKYKLDDEGTLVLKLKNLNENYDFTVYHAGSVYEVTVGSVMGMTDIRVKVDLEPKDGFCWLCLIISVTVILMVLAIFYRKHLIRRRGI